MIISALKINKLVAVLVGQIQVLEDAALDTLIGRYLDEAVGRQLDGIGNTVGEPRTDIDSDTYTETASAADERYREKIRQKIFVNSSSGTPEEMIQIIKTFLDDGAEVSFSEVYPAKVRLAVNDAPIPAGLQDFMQTVAPAGVDLDVVDEDDVFRVGRDRAGERL